MKYFKNYRIEEFDGDSVWLSMMGFWFLKKKKLVIYDLVDWCKKKNCLERVLVEFNDE